MMKKVILIMSCFLPICLIAGSGDVNGDGEVNVADIVEIINHLKGMTTDQFYESEADVNNDGYIDGTDIQIIHDKIMSRRGERINTLGTINILLSEDNKFLNECTAISMFCESEIEDGGFSIETSYNDAVQPIFIIKNDKIFLMARQPIHDGENVELSVESTALGIATLHPLFAPIGGADFDAIVELIKNSPMYQPYYEEVEKLIKDQKDIFNESNERLIATLEALYDDILAIIDNKILSVRGRTRSPFSHPNIDPTYIRADITDNILTLQCTGLTPSYYGTVTTPSGVVNDYAVKSRSDYGGMDIFKPYDQFDLGPKCPFTFSIDGEYYFELSRTTDEATRDFYFRLANSLLNIIGFDFGDATVIREVATTISNALLDAGMTAFGPDQADFIDWFGVAYAATIDYLQRDTSIIAWKKKWGILWLYAKFLSGVWNIYGKIKGAANIGSRIAYAVNAPEEINFSLCYNCESKSSYPEVSLSIISGDEQVGNPGTKLSQPLIVYVLERDDDRRIIDPSPDHVVKFEVLTGGGSIEYEYATIDISCSSQAFWTLGMEGRQRIKAVVVDVLTKQEISEPVYFVATFEKDHGSFFYCPDDNHPHMIDLGLPSGTKWACCNVGASHPEEMGGYYQWGVTEENKKTLANGTIIYNQDVSDYKYFIDYQRDEWGHIRYDSGINQYIGSNIKGTIYDVAHVKWGGSWCMPTVEQFRELIEFDEKLIWIPKKNGTIIKNIDTREAIFIPLSFHDGTYGTGYYDENCGLYWTSDAAHIGDVNYFSDKNIWAHIVYIIPRGMAYKQFEHVHNARNVRPVAK